MIFGSVIKMLDSHRLDVCSSRISFIWIIVGWLGFLRKVVLVNELNHVDELVCQEILTEIWWKVLWVGSVKYQILRRPVGDLICSCWYISEHKPPICGDLGCLTLLLRFFQVINVVECICHQVDLLGSQQIELELNSLVSDKNGWQSLIISNIDEELSLPNHGGVLALELYTSCSILQF